MLQDALWTTLYSDEEIRFIEEHDAQDKATQNSIQQILELVDED